MLENDWDTDSMHLCPYISYGSSDADALLPPHPMGEKCTATPSKTARQIAIFEKDRNTLIFNNLSYKITFFMKNAG